MDPQAKLPPFIIAELYKNSLVEIESSTSLLPDNGDQSTKFITDEFSVSNDNEALFLGNNAQHITVVVAERAAKYINDEDLFFLTNILKACQLIIADIAIINTAKTPVTYPFIREELGAKFILIFGIEPTEIKLPFVIPHFQVQQYAGCTIVIAPPLNELNKEGEDGKILKTKLWLSLQRCFNIETSKKAK